MTTITLTALEAILLGAALSLFSGLAVKTYLAGRYVARTECDVRMEILARQKRSMDLIFAMLRAIIANMDNLSPEKREEILNLRLVERD